MKLVFSLGALALVGLSSAFDLRDVIVSSVSVPVGGTLGTAAAATSRFGFTPSGASAGSLALDITLSGSGFTEGSMTVGANGLAYLAG